MKTGFVGKKVSPNYGMLKEKAREMRREPTDAELILWQVLSEDKLGVKFRRQHVIGEFIVDFACLAKSLVIEIDGDYHNNDEQKAYDTLRTNWLEQQGFTVIRFTNEEVLYHLDHVITTIQGFVALDP